MLIFVVLFSTVIGMKAPPAAANENAPIEYEIYPIPHQVTYHQGSTKLDKTIQVIYDDTIDSVTRKKVEDTFKENGYPAPTIGTQVADDKVNVLIGTKGSNGPVDTYAATNNTSQDMDFSKIDAYQLDIQNNTIMILGKDTDASFYGVVTLNAILAQASGKEVRNLTIQDYANTKIRGFIEGYYGIPWSNEDRMSLMRFGGQFKATSYVFAPKDDPFHREKWAEAYPPEKLAEIREMAQVGNETKTRFVWTISPLAEVAKISQTGGDPMLKLQENTAKMLAKFDQLYDVGVRQFGVLGDDVGSLPRNYVVALMHSVSEWAKAKGDVYDTLYCPASYNSGWAWNPAELNDYEKGFDKNIQIFWTGSTTCAPINQSTINTFKNSSNGGVTRRDPLFWLNWPVNDVDMSRVFLGKGEMLQTGIQNLAGAVTNPMQEAEASKVAIFAVADYAWNTETFNAQKSWEDSFKYIEPNVEKELHILAKHMSDANPGGLTLSESEDIKSLLDTITSKVNSGSTLKDSAPEATAELQKISDAANEFLAKTKNANLKKELEPFVKALRDMVLADIEFIKTDIAIEDGNKADTWNHFGQAIALRQRSLDYDRLLISGTMKAKPAAKRLQPFTNNLENKITPKVAKFLDLQKAETKASIFTNVDGYKKLSIIEKPEITSIDGTTDITLKENEYVGIKLSRIKDVIEIDVPAVDRLTLESSLNGIEWNTVENVNNRNGARYVRLINKKSEAIEFSLDTFKVTSYEVEPKSLQDTNLTFYQSSPLSLLDGNLATHTWTDKAQKAGDYITYHLGQIISLTSLKLYVAEGEKDFPRHAVLEASLDGKEWNTVMTIGNQDGPNEGEVTDQDRIGDIFDKHEAPYRFKEVRDLNQKAKFLRFKLTQTKVGTGNWLKMQEIVINDGELFPEINDPTITTESMTNIGFGVNNIIDGKLSTKFKPAGTGAGEILYHIGEVGTRVTGITILEDPSNLSGGTVSVKTLDGWKELGTITSGYQSFNTNLIQDILDLKIDWTEGNTPSIYEVKVDKRDGNISEFIALYKQVTELTSSDYTKDSWSLLESAKELADKVLQRENATQTEFDAASIALKSALSQLKKVADKSQLDAKIKEVKALDSSLYTADSWAAVEKALTDAEKVWSKEDATQSEVDRAVKRLEAATNKLVGKQTGWVLDKGKWYYFNSNGEMQTKWAFVDGKWYYLDDGNGKMQVGWVNSNKKWYFLASNGAMQTGWVKDANKWYFLASNGAMQTGWVKDANKWYFLASDGAMQTGWVKDANKWYFLASNGAMQTGWLLSNNRWYFLDSTGKMMTGWVYTGNKWYYLFQDGKMAANTTVQGYKLGAGGAWIN